MWNRIMGAVAKEVPPFNDYLLRRFRSERIARAPEYLDATMPDIITVFGDRVKYNGYTILTPEERIDYLRNNNILNGRVDVRPSNYRMCRYEFIFDNMAYHIYVPIPYMTCGALRIAGTYQYPILPIAEKCLHFTADGIRVKILKAPLMFWRNRAVTFTTASDKHYRVPIITTKIHQKSRKGGKPPALLLYFLASMGYEETLTKFGITDDEFSFVEEVDNVEGYEYVEVNKAVVIKYKKELMRDVHKSRFIASMIYIINYNKNATVGALTGQRSGYYKVTLGMFTYNPKDKPALLYTNAEEHLAMTDILLDLISKQQFSANDLHVETIYDLFFEVWYNIDKWIIEYNPLDLYQKKIGSLDQMMAGLVKDIMSNAYWLVNNKKLGLTHATFQRFVRSSSKPNSNITKSAIFRGNPTRHNGNDLLSIQAKKVRTLESIEINMGAGTPKKTTVSNDMLKAHKSHIGVESITALSSSPVIGGTINVFVRMDEYGNLIPPPYYHELDNVFE